MPIATPEEYARMIDDAKAGGWALPAFNVTSSQTLNAVLSGLSEAGSDGIIQVTTGGADAFAGHSVRNRAAGAVAMATFAHEVAKNYDITVALHTDHCPRSALDSFLLPVLAASEDRVRSGGGPLFQSHMWDGSALPIDENLATGVELLERAARIGAVLEVEIGAVGGEEEGVEHTGPEESLYSRLEDVVEAVEVLGTGSRGRWIAALTFGNVHGVTAGRRAQLRPELLAELQAGVAARFGLGDRPLDLVFHGGSGSTDDEIQEAVRNGVVKMNIDSDTQYAFTRSVADWMFREYDAVLKVDGGVGDKKRYDPRAWGRAAEAAMAARVTAAAVQLGSAGHSKV